MAQVILRPASGQRITGESVITAETLYLYAPRPESAATASRAFSDAGFEVGPVAGVGFSLSGSRELFSRFFQVEVADAAEGGWASCTP